MNLLGLCMVVVGFFMLQDMSIFLRPRLYGELATIGISIHALVSEKPDIRRYQIVLNFIFLIVPGVFGLLLRVNPETVTGSGLFLVVGSINALAMANIKKPMAWFLWLENRRNVERQRIDQVKTELQQYQ